MDYGFPKTVKNGQLPMEFWECSIADKISNVKSYYSWKYISMGNFW